MTTKNYRYYERDYFDLYNITYNDTTTFGQGEQTIGKSKLSYNKLTGLGVLKLDFDFLKAPNLEAEIASLPNGAPTPNSLIEESVNIGEVSFAFWIAQGSRTINIKHISGDFSTVLRRRMIINLLGLWG